VTKKMSSFTQTGDSKYEKFVLFHLYPPVTMEQNVKSPVKSVYITKFKQK